MAPRPALHTPDEPTALAGGWLAELHAGTPLDEVLRGDGGVTAWLWSRWCSLATVGFSESDLAAVVQGYKREIWLWLAGERTWAHCSSGLVGRVDRRLDEGTSGER